MLLVRVSIGTSAIHGLGLFAVDAIPKGTLVWKLQPGFDLLFTVDDLGRLSGEVAANIEMYIYMVPTLPLWILDADHARHLNHSRDPNIGNVDSPLEQRALRDINAGEEMTCDYRQYEGEEHQPYY